MSTLKDRVTRAFERRRAIAAPGERVTQAALARAAGVKPPSVADWFNGKTHSLKGEVLLGAAAYLKVRPEWLGSGKGPMEIEGRGQVVQSLPQRKSERPWPFPRVDRDLIDDLDRDALHDIQTYMLGVLSGRPKSPGVKRRASR
jgi:transcriptional regulator with XRE-family HTH domain